MPTETTPRDRTLMAALAVVAGLLLLTLLPVAVTQAMDAVLKGIAVKAPASGNPLLATAPRIVITFFPLWAGLSMAAGATLLVIARSLQRGERWARPAAVGLFAIPSITGAYFSGPIMFFVPKMAPYFVGVALMGLIPYFTVLLVGRAPRGEKLAAFFLFLLLGVTAAWSFSNGGSSLRMFMARPEPYKLATGHYGFLLGIPVVWIGVAAVVAAIPLLAARARAGWFLAMSGSASILAGSTVLFVTHTTTQEFLYGMIMAAGCLILLLLPALGGRVMGKGG